MSNPNPTPDLAALAAALQQTAQVLLTLSSQNQPDRPKEMTPKPPAADDGGETRSYYFPAVVVRREQALLGELRSNDFLDLLDHTHALLSGVARVMRNTNAEAKIKGSAFVSMGALLDQVCLRLWKIRNLYGEVVPIRR